LADVTLPSLGESVTEGIITQWFKKVGDLVARDEPLFEVSTDKVDSEMPSPAAGVLVQILAEEGDTVETGARVAVIDESQSVATSSDSPAAPSATASEAPRPTPAATPVASAPASGASGVVLSPVVRRILRDAGIRPQQVRGTGAGGAITRRDAELAVIDGPGEALKVAMSNGRRRMGQHMVFSSQVTPHGFVAIAVDGSIFDVLDLVGRSTDDGVTISDEVLVAFAAVKALKEFSILNATCDGDQIIFHHSINLGFTRAIDEDGMLVPVVHAASSLTLPLLARRVNEINEHVESRQLTTDDLMGGTFTIQSSPSEHTLFTQPIIIQPQVAVMSVGSRRYVPVIATSNGKPSVQVGSELVLGLSFDHRICEPRMAAKFLERVAEILSSLDLAAEL
jgi:2-oxoglutarate dehydrogenase E2 component (dihydrolipoamide succinyltransferase)